MASIELAYPHLEVSTPEQVSLLIETVLNPAADIIDGGSFTSGTTHEVARAQKRSLRDCPGSYTGIGFRAVRDNYDEDMTDITFSVWTHTAVDTLQIPFSEAATIAADKYIQGLGQRVLDQLDIEEEDVDIDIDIEMDDEVEEQRDFYINKKELTVVRDLDFVYVRNGEFVWADSLDIANTLEVPAEMDQLEDFGELEKSINSTFTDLDLRVIANILGDLGLLVAAQ